MHDGSAKAAKAPPKNRTPAGIIFSQRDRHVWATWGKAYCQVDLGPAEEVEEMMRDYLAQTALAKLLAPAEGRPG